MKRLNLNRHVRGRRLPLRCAVWLLGLSGLSLLAQEQQIEVIVAGDDEVIIVSEVQVVDKKATEADKKADDKKADDKKADDKKATEAAKKAVEKVKAAVQAAIGQAHDHDHTAAGTAAGDGSDAPKKEEVKAASPPAAPKPKGPPQPPMFRMRDSTRVAGHPQLESLTLETAYGQLVIPVRDVVRLRFAASQDQDLASRVESLIQQLGNEEFDLREEAMQSLREVGTPALEALEKAAQSEDEEIKSRAEKLTAEIEEEEQEDEEEEEYLIPLKGADDEVVTPKFTAMGRVVETSFKVKTPYGELTLNREDILSVVFKEAALTLHTITVPGTTFAAANKWVETKLKVATGTKFTMTASGQINLQNYSRTTGPEGTTNISGNQLGKFPVGSLVGKIGEKGAPFLVGSKYSSEAETTGSIFLAVSLQNGNVSGEYSVEIEIEEEPDEGEEAGEEKS